MLAKYSGPDTNTIVLYKGYISNKRPLVFTASQYAIMLMHSQQKSFKDIAKSAGVAPRAVSNGNGKMH